MNNTIISQITPIGYSGVGIIRISGKLTDKIIHIIINKKLKPRYAYYLNFKNHKGEIIDKGIAIYFCKPFSYTGEDILELHAHGGQLIINLLIKVILSISNEISIAKPGEFTKRAFINNKIDLLQAESINNLINNNYSLSIPYLINNINGNSSKIINSILKKIIFLEIIIENILNFDLEYNNNDKIIKIILGIYKILSKICHFNLSNNIINHGLNITIIGLPNSGKSSLFNALIEKKKAIVTNIKGTTRDSLTELIKINNFNIYITDTAGIRLTNNIIEKIGIKYTFKNILLCDYIFYIFDIKNNLPISLKKILNINKLINKNNKTIFYIFNKIDLLNIKFNHKKIIKNNTYINIIFLSCFNKLDILKLKKIIYKEILINIKNNKNIKFIFQERHIFCFKKSLKHLKNIINYINNNNFLVNDLIATELILVKKFIEEIIGKHITSKEILDKIFSNFCIGK